MMRIYVASLLLSTVVALTSASDVPECPCNSEMRDVSKEPCEPTCNDRESMHCDNSHLEKNTCSSGRRECRCTKGMVRNEHTNECVWPTDCPRLPTEHIPTTEYIPLCGENEEHAHCGRDCEGTCKNPNIPECDLKVCLEQSCRCKSGHVRDEKTDKCIAKEMCPRPECSKTGEIRAACGRMCEGTCDNPMKPKICLKNVCSKKECRCNLDAGLVRDRKTGECVPIDHCPKKVPITRPMTLKQNTWQQ